MSSNNLLIVMLLITLLVVGASALVGRSLAISIIRDTTVVQKKQAAEKQLVKDIDAAPQLVDAYGKLDDKARILADALPGDVDFPSIIVTLENMTRNAGLRLKSVTPSQATVATTGATATTDGSVAPKPQSYKFGLAVSGSYAGLQKFLGEIETSARPMRILDVQLAGGGNSLTGQIDVETYYQDKAQLPFSKETVK